MAAAAAEAARETAETEARQLKPELLRLQKELEELHRSEAQTPPHVKDIVQQLQVSPLPA